MKRYSIGETSPEQYSSLTDEERAAWLEPLNTSYHSFHIERMGADTFRFRDSQSAFYYIGTHFEVSQALWSMLTCRKVDPDRRSSVEVLRVLSQEEVDDLLSDL